jgi:hypothetical protein
MKEVKCYKLSDADTDMPEGLYDDSTIVVFVPSGYKGAWLIISETPAYELSIRYTTDEEVKHFKLNEQGGNKND